MVAVIFEDGFFRIMLSCNVIKRTSTRELRDLDSNSVRFGISEIADMTKICDDS